MYESYTALSIIHNKKRTIASTTPQCGRSELLARYMYSSLRATLSRS